MLIYTGIRKRRRRAAEVECKACDGAGAHVIGNGGRRPMYQYTEETCGECAGSGVVAEGHEYSVEVSDE